MKMLHGGMMKKLRIAKNSSQGRKNLHLLKKM